MFFTASGKRIDFSDQGVRVQDVHLPDIAHHLERIERFGGAGRRRWSVLAHTLTVSRLVPGPCRLHALLHDAAEAYVGDMPTPLKRLFPDFAELEQDVLRTIYDALNLDPPGAETLVAIKHADNTVLAEEARVFGPPGLYESLGQPRNPDAGEAIQEVLLLAVDQREKLFIDSLKADRNGL